MMENMRGIRGIEEVGEEGERGLGIVDLALLNRASYGGL
jgi:hypothetical protein